MSNESMANYISETPSEIAELLAENHFLKQKIGNLQAWLEHYKNCIPLGEKELIRQNKKLKDYVKNISGSVTLREIIRRPKYD